jgi:hypothetical protein
MGSDEKRTCGACGYDLQGLDDQVLCPECGTEPKKVKAKTRKSIVGEGLMGVIDSSIAVQGLEPVPDIRVRLMHFARIAGFFTIALVVLQFLVTFAIIPIGLYRFALFGMSFFWPAVAVGLMPASVDDSMPQVYRYIRKVVPYSQWCWAAGYTLWFVFHLPTEAGTLSSNLGNFFPLILLHAIAGIGLVGIVFWLHDLALRMNLDHAAKRMNLVAIMMSTWGVIVFVAPWKEYAASGDDSAQTALYWFYIVVLMFPWYWILIQLTLSFFEFASDSTWSLKYEGDREGREGRIREKREAMDQENDPFA